MLRLDLFSWHFLKAQSLVAFLFSIFFSIDWFSVQENLLFRFETPIGCCFTYKCFHFIKSIGNKCILIYVYTSDDLLFNDGDNMLRTGTQRGFSLLIHTSRGVLQSVRQAEDLHPSTCVVAAEGTKQVILCFSRDSGGKKQSVVASLSAVQSAGRPLLSLNGATCLFREGNTLPCRLVLKSI